MQRHVTQKRQQKKQKKRQKMRKMRKKQREYENAESVSFASPAVRIVCVAYVERRPSSYAERWWVKKEST